MQKGRSVKKLIKNIPEEKSPLESQERDGWMILKII
jgi:DNA-directed RNA polymerase beta' subunit